MSPTVFLALIGWPAVVAVLFALLPPIRAVIASMLGGWMFLPMAAIKLIPGVPDVNKANVLCLSVLLAAAVRDTPRFMRLRPTAVDVVAVVWTLCPLVSSLASGFDISDGIATSLAYAVGWSLPYLLGRVYFAEPAGIRELLIGMVVAGLVYLPFVLVEVRLSPQLHTWVYGFHQHEFIQSKRGGGFRPTVFMQHGLAVAIFMATSAVAACWLWLSGSATRLWRAPMWVVAVVLVATTILCKSSGASILMMGAILASVATVLLKFRLPLLGFCLIAPVYLFTRLAGLWNADSMLRLIGGGLGDDREGSLATRLKSEDIVLRELTGHWTFGVGRLGALFNNVDDGEKFIADALWVISFGRNGLVGLVSLFGLLVGPGLLMLWHLRKARNTEPRHGAPLGGVSILAMYSVDCLLNAMPNPVFLMIAGGLVGLVQWESTRRTGIEVSPRVPFLQT